MVVGRNFYFPPVDMALAGVKHQANRFSIAPMMEWTESASGSMTWWRSCAKIAHVRLPLLIFSFLSECRFARSGARSDARGCAFPRLATILQEPISAGLGHEVALGIREVDGKVA